MRQATVSWRNRDHDRWMTLTAVIGLSIGVVLAIFGLPGVGLHAPTHQLGIMDPLCGGTRSLRFTLLGRWEDAWRYNPLSPLLAVGAALVVLRHVAGTLTGRWLTVRIRPVWLLLIAAIVLIPLEVNQQLHAELLQGP